MKTAPPEAMVMYAVVKAAKAYLRTVGAQLSALGLQPGQDMLLSQLWDGDGLSQSELIARMSVEPPTVAKALRRLERGGLVTRRRDAQDARVSHVCLTTRGKRLRRPIEAIWTSVEEQGAAALTPAEKKMLQQLASRVFESLKSRSE